MPTKKPAETAEQIETPKPKPAKAVKDTSANAVVSRLSPEINTDTSQKVEYKTRKGNTISTSKG
tara:strand:- start:290 stop:481 length:192 start_codon:yes stop_codon:yes gene_type:complete